jgi:two-component system sensor histidine kinase UhpB
MPLRRASRCEGRAFASALRWIACQFSRRTGIPVTVRGPRDLARFAPAIEIGLYRILQEELINVTKHARVNHATVSIAVQRNEVELVVAGDGTGFDSNIVSRSGGLAGGA